MSQVEKKPTAKARVADRVRRAAGVNDLESRVAALERELEGYRSTHVRLAELIDVATELLIPMSQQDSERIQEVIAKYTDELDQES